MAYYEGEEEIYKCQQHPSKRRRSTGVCPLCLIDRLKALCPDCANPRPCSCSSSSSTSSSSSSSSSLHHLNDVGSVGRISTLIDHEPSFRRSRSAAFPFFRSARFSSDDDRATSRKSFSVWSVLWRHKSKRTDKNNSNNDNQMEVVVEDIEELKMRRSRSVAASITAVNEMRSSPAPSKGKGWYFPSPMKVFRHSKQSTKVVLHERSPLHRG